MSKVRASRAMTPAFLKEREAAREFIRYKRSNKRSKGERFWYRYVSSKVQMSRLDGLLINEDTGGHHLIAGIEIKWRRFCWDTLVSIHKGEMLMPADKLLAGQAFAYAFGVPTLLLYLLDDCLVVQKVVGDKGDKLNVTREVYEESNRTIEGGTTRRKNSYITIAGCEKIPIERSPLEL